MKNSTPSVFLSVMALFMLYMAASLLSLHHRFNLPCPQPTAPPTPVKIVPKKNKYLRKFF